MRDSRSFAMLLSPLSSARLWLARRAPVFRSREFLARSNSAHRAQTRGRFAQLDLGIAFYHRPGEFTSLKSIFLQRNTTDSQNRRQDSCFSGRESSPRISSSMLDASFRIRLTAKLIGISTPMPAASVLTAAAVVTPSAMLRRDARIA